VNRERDVPAVKARGVKGLRIENNTFESASATPHLVTVFGCADVQLKDNRIPARDGKATILHGQMERGEIKIDPGAPWVLESK